MPVTPETRDRLTAGLVQLIRTGRQVSSRAAGSIYGDLPSFGWSLLLPLERDGAQRCSALAAQAGIDVSVASRQVSALERAGYVHRRPDPVDGRASLIGLSPAGVEALAHTREVRGQWATESLAAWSQEEAQQFSALLEKLADGLDAAGRRRPPRPAA